MSEKYWGALSGCAFQDSQTAGRLNNDNDRDLKYECDRIDAVLNPYGMDIFKFLEDKGIRRQQGLEQVIAAPINYNISNRNRHTLSVVAMAVRLAERLGYNAKLVQAIGLGHDVGHSILGHVGEEFFAECIYRRELAKAEKNCGAHNPFPQKESDCYFAHARNSIIYAQRVARKGIGLNISYEVLCGILDHSASGRDIVAGNALFHEQAIIWLCDPGSYLPNDLGDAHREGYIDLDNLPLCIKKLADGANTPGCIQNNIRSKIMGAAIKESLQEGYFSFYKCDEAQWFKEMKQWMYKNVYYNMGKKRENQKNFLPNIYSYVEECYPDYDPLLIMSLMVDWDIEKLVSDMMHNPGNGLEKYGFHERIIGLPKCREFDFHTYDLDKSHFKIPDLLST